MKTNRIQTTHKRFIVTIFQTKLNFYVKFRLAHFFGTFTMVLQWKNRDFEWFSFTLESKSHWLRDKKTHQTKSFKSSSKRVQKLWIMVTMLMTSKQLFIFFFYHFILFFSYASFSSLPFFNVESKRKTQMLETLNHTNA